MATEIELKLQVPATDVDQLIHMMENMAGKSGRCCLLKNQYYDTPDLQLSAAKVALRIRRQGDAFIQTFKTRGHSIAGLHQRQEWEWPVKEPVLDLNLLTLVDWPEHLNKEMLHHQLQVIFCTDFTRTLWHITYETSELEVVIDQGQIRVGELNTDTPYQEPICELEIELKSGEASAIATLATQLQTQLPTLQPSDVSKAQRGYRLFNAARND